MVSEGVYERVRRLLPPPPARLLNIGCDHGEESTWYPPEYEVHNCDIRDMSRPNFTRCDLNEPWPYPDGSFDIVVGVEIIEHLENPWHFLRECKRTCRPGGTIIVTTPNILSKRDRERFLEEGIFVWLPSEDHINPIPKWELERICRDRGLEILEETYAGDFDEEILILKIGRGDT